MSRRPLSNLAIGIYLLLSDIVCLLILFNLVYWIRLETWLGIRDPGIYGAILITLLTLYVFNSYQGSNNESSLKGALHVGLSVVLAGSIITVFVYVGGFGLSQPVFNRGVMPVTLLGFVLWATLSRYYLSEWLKKRKGTMFWIVIGMGEQARLLWKDFKKSGIGGDLFFIDDSNGKQQVSADDALFTIDLGIDSLEDAITPDSAGIVLATENSPTDELLTKLMHLRLDGLHVYELADFYESFMMKVPVFHLQQGWFVLSQGFQLLHHTAWLKLKGMVDIFIAMVMLVLSLPLMVIVGLLIKLTSHGAVIYKQVRVGKNGVSFTIYKFRTMVDDAESEGAIWTQESDPRITKIGKVLRRTRIDELPQLFNILRGDMSFIGPRPERPDFTEELEKQIPFYDIRYIVKPGITGWAQVMYPYGASVEDAREKLQYDLYYIKNYSLMLDFWIMIKTIRVVAGGKGR